MTCDKDHHWYGEIPDPDKYFGFIYLITNNVTGMRYIGKKQYHFTRKVKQAGTTRRKTVIKESDWRYYTGSCNPLNKDIKELGKDNFSFIILYHSESKGGLHWLEIEAQVRLNVLKEVDINNERLYYNNMIAGIKFIPKDECPEVAEKQRGAKNTIFKAIANGNHPTLGKGHSQKTKDTLSRKNKAYWEGLPQEVKDKECERLVGLIQGIKNAKFRPWAYKEPDEDWVEMHNKTIIDWCIENRHPKVRISSFKKPKRKNAYWLGWDFKILAMEDRE